MTQWSINLGGPFDDAMGKLETLAIMKLGSPDGEIWGPTTYSF